MLSDVCDMSTFFILVVYSSCQSSTDLCDVDSVTY